MLIRSTVILLCGALAACGQPAGETPATNAAPPPPAATTSAPPAATPSALPRTAAPTGAVAYIISPVDGAVVSNPVQVVFGLKGIGVVPAGIDRPDAGHHHLLIDAEVPPVDLPIPNDATHMHFGAGQTETTLTLAPGRHTLRLLLGNHLHIPHDPPIVSAPITIEVQ